MGVVPHRDGNLLVVLVRAAPSTLGALARGASPRASATFVQGTAPFRPSLACEGLEPPRISFLDGERDGNELW